MNKLLSLAIFATITATMILGTTFATSDIFAKKTIKKIDQSSHTTQSATAINFGSGGNGGISVFGNSNGGSSSASASNTNNHSPINTGNIN